MSGIKEITKETTKSTKPTAPYTRAVMYTVLVFVFTSGGYYGGYYVTKQAPLHTLLSPEYETVLHEVVRIIDGDTIELSSGAKVRLLGISAPEHSACGGTESTQAVTDLLLGNQVILQRLDCY